MSLSFFTVLPFLFLEFVFKTVLLEIWLVDVSKLIFNQTQIFKMRLNEAYV